MDTWIYGLDTFDGCLDEYFGWMIEAISGIDSLEEQLRGCNVVHVFLFGMKGARRPSQRRGLQMTLRVNEC